MATGTEQVQVESPGADPDDRVAAGQDEDHAEQPGIQHEPIPVPEVTNVVRLDDARMHK